MPTVEELKTAHDRLQEGLPSDKIAIREGILLNVGEGEYDSYPRFGFQFFCFRNPDCVKEMDLFIKYAKGKKCLLDIGSYHSLFSLVFTEINKEAVAYSFEPFQEPFIMSMKLCNGNERISPIQAALSDNSGKIQLFECDGHLTGKQTIEDQKSTWVNSISGDSFCFGCFPNIIPDIIKIDTEGSELNVLRGIHNVIARHKPVIFLELHYSSLSKQDVIDISSLIGWAGYNIIDTETDLLIPLSDLMKPTEGEKRIILK